MDNFRIPKIIFTLLQEKGLDAQAYFKEHGLNPEVLKDPLPRLSAPEFGKVLDLIKKELDDPCLVLNCSLKQSLENFGLFGLGFFHSPNFGTALEKAARYKLLMAPEKIDLSLTLEGDLQVSVRMLCADFPQSHDIAHGCLSFLFLKGKELATGNMKLKSVHFRAKELADPKLYEEVFGVRPILSQKEDKLVFDGDVRSLVFPHFDSHLAPIFDKNLEDLRSQVISTQDIKSQTIKIIKENLNGALPSLKEVSAKLGMGERSLQKELQAEDTTFGQILESCRKEAAEKYLKSKSFELAEVAFLLGYSNTTTFGRAFKNWFGVTPGVFKTVLA